MRRIDRYILGEIIGPFFSALAFLFALLFVIQMLRGIEVILGSSVGLADLGYIALCLAPHFAVMATPISLFFAVVIGVGRIVEDREILALMASGVSPWRFWLSPVLLALLVAGLGIGFGYGPQPRGLAEVDHHINELIKRNMVGDVKPGVFYDAIRGITIYAQGTNPKTHRFDKVLLVDERAPESSVLVLSREGKVEPNDGMATLRLRLKDGEIHRANKASVGTDAEPDDDYIVAHFQDGLLDLQAADLLKKNNFGATRRESMTPAELQREAVQLRADGREDRARVFEMTRMRRVSGPLASIVFALCAVPLAMGRRRSAQGVGMIAALACYVGYYTLTRIGDSLGEAGTLSAWVAALLPNLAFLLLGIALVRRAIKAQA